MTMIASFSLYHSNCHKITRFLVIQFPVQQIIVNFSDVNKREEIEMIERSKRLTNLIM